MKYFYIKYTTCYANIWDEEYIEADDIYAAEQYASENMYDVLEDYATWDDLDDDEYEEYEESMSFEVTEISEEDYKEATHE